MKDKRLHGDPDRIMEHAEAGYCLSHSEELHLCKYTRSLRSALAEKTAQVERLREFAEHIDQWSNAYPEGMFPDPAPEQIDQVCKTLGCRIDSIAAMILRETVKPFGDLAREALAATASNPCPSCAESVDGKPGNGACMQCLEERSNE